jgi:hypothetical protein
MKEENKIKPQFQELKFDTNSKGEISSIYMMNVPDISQSDKGKLKKLRSMLDDLSGDYDGNDEWQYSYHFEKHIQPMIKIVDDLLKSLDK